MKRVSPFLFSLFITIFTCAIFSSTHAEYEPNWESLDSRPIPAWFDDAKFGIFIHWGVYSVPAWAPKNTYSEWYLHALTEGSVPNVLTKYTKNVTDPTQKFHQENFGKDYPYKNFAPLFKAELFNPDEWTDLFLKSGARYIALTSKHHDGYCLWPAPDCEDWNSVDVGPKRDLVGDLAKAVRKTDVKFGIYYSLYEWYHPLYLKDPAKYAATHMIPQLKDMVTKYSPALVWTDGEWDHPEEVWQSKEFLAWLFNEAPNKDEVVVNDRWGKGTRFHHGGFYTTEYGKADAYRKQYENGRKWEECRGIGASFGYNRNESIYDYKSTEEMLHLLIDVVAHGGNLLLNIGPTADGRIPVIMQERLLQTGKWLEANGEAIYGTKPWRVQAEGDSIRYTTKDNAVYAISLKWPGEKLELESPETNTETELTILGHNEKLNWKSENGKLIIDVPILTIDKLPAQHAYVFKLTNVD